MKTMLDDLANKPKNPNMLEYMSARRVALLGKGHAAADIKMFNPDDHFKGVIRATLTEDKKKNKGISFQIVGQKRGPGGKMEPQLANRSELETVISDSLAGTPYAKYALAFNWS